MKQEETKRIVPDAKTAVLFVHGIAGSPNHFRMLIPLEDLVPAQWSCCNVLIEGHGKRVEDFSHSSMQAWKRHVFGVFEDLCRSHDNVIIVGHSMGTLFALQMALQRPEKIPFVFLLDVPLRVGLRLFGVRNLIAYGFGKLDMADPLQAATSMACSIAPTEKIWKYLGWIPRLLELLHEMHATSQILKELSVPAYAFQSRYDELVSSRSEKLLKNSGKVNVCTLQQSTHFYYGEEDVKSVRAAFSSLCLDV